MAIVYVDGDSPLAESMAQEAAELLFAEYPNHSWWVECRGGLLIIKHFMFSGYRGIIGMVRHMSDIQNDAEYRKKEILTGGGELLERAHVARGRYNGDPSNKMDLENDQQRNRWGGAPYMEVYH